jgi:hypothetical protein
MTDVTPGVGACQVVMGVARLVTCLAEMPFFHYSGFLIRR